MDEIKETVTIELVEVCCTNCHRFEVVNNLFAKTLTIHKKKCHITHGCNGTLYITEKKISKELTEQAKTEEQTELTNIIPEEEFE